MSILPSKLFKLSKKTEYITVTELSKFFSIEPRQLNQILTSMKWIEKEHYIWWVATELGKENGAIEYTDTRNRIRYVYWEKDIMYNQKLISTIKATIRSYIENNLYEESIKEQFIDQGYTVWHHSKDKMQQDKNKNITLIAKKDKKILLIHCRDNQLDISLDELKVFQQQRDDFKVDNPVFENYNLSLHYSMSGFFLTEEAYEYVEDNRGDITYEVVKVNTENNWMESLLLREKKGK